MTGWSGVGKDLFASDIIEPLDLPVSDETAVRLDAVRGAAGPSGGRGHNAPVGHEGVTFPDARAAQDGAGDNPLHVEGVGPVSSGDDNGSGVLDPGGVDPVHGVGAGESAGFVSPDGQIAGEGAGVQHREESNHADDPSEPLHHLKSTREREIDHEGRLIIPRWLKVAAGFFSVFIVAALAFAIFEPIQVLPRLRLAPGYSLISQDGTSVTSETGRGAVTLYTFRPLECGDDCAGIDATMAEVRDRVTSEVDLAGVDFRLITIALDPVSSPGQLTAPSEASGADGKIWQWVGGDADRIRNVVGTGFRQFFETEYVETDFGSENASGTEPIRFDPGYVLVDGSGVVRGDYRYQTLASNSDKIVNHVAILGEEIRYASGAAAVAYEAAHLFLCYP